MVRRSSFKRLAWLAATPALLVPQVAHATNSPGGALFLVSIGFIVPAFVVVVGVAVAAKVRARGRADATGFGVGALMANVLCVLGFGHFRRALYREDGLGIFAYLPAAGILVALYGMKVAWSIANGSHLQDEPENTGRGPT
jgi:predicted permease